MSPNSDDEQQQRAWAKSFVSAATSVSATAPPASSRSAKSPLAVSVSGPAFHASALEVVASSQTRSPHSSSNSKSRMASSSAPTPSLKREFRGKCLYQSRKCENERALKRNGKAHNLCDEHRSKQNQHQRKFDAKKFSRKRRRGSSGEGPADDDDEDDDNADGDDDETMSEDRRRPGGRRLDVKDTEALKRESPPPVSRSDKSQRKIRRFDGAKHAGRRPCHEMETASQYQIKSEIDAEQSGAADVRSFVGLVRPAYVPEQYRGDPASYHHEQQQYQAREYPPRPPQQHEYTTSHPGPEHQYHHQYIHSATDRDPERSRYYHRAQETPRGVSATSPSDHPSSRTTSFVERPLVPLRPLSAIVSTPSSRISVGSQQEHLTGERGPTPEQVYRQARGRERERRHTDGSFEAHDGFGERRASYDGGSGEAGSYPPLYQAERSSYPPGRYPAAQEASVVRSSSPHALGTAYAPQYSPSELMAASILVPGAAPVARHPRYTESSISGGSADERGYHHHTSVSPRGMPPMYHPSSYAISPHHARLQTSGPSSASYLRAQQQMQSSAERERREIRSSDLQRRHSPPSAAAASSYASTGTSRMLPSLATQVSAAISSAPAGSAQPFASKQAPTPRALPPARDLSSQHQQYRQHENQAISHHSQHQQQQQSRHHPAITPPATPVLPSLAPFRSIRGPSKAASQQQHYSTP